MSIMGDGWECRVWDGHRQRASSRASLGAEDCSDKFEYLHSFKKTIFTIKRYMKFKRCTGQETKGLGQIFCRAEWDFLRAPVVK